MFNHIPHRHDVEFGVGMRRPQVTKACVSSQALDLRACSLALASGSIPTARTPYSLATLHKTPTRSRNQAASYLQAAPIQPPPCQMSVAVFVRGILVCSDTRIRGGIVELLVGRAEGQVIELRKANINAHEGFRHFRTSVWGNCIQFLARSQQAGQSGMVTLCGRLSLCTTVFIIFDSSFAHPK